MSRCRGAVVLIPVYIKQTLCTPVKAMCMCIKFRGYRPHTRRDPVYGHSCDMRFVLDDTWLAGHASPPALDITGPGSAAFIGGAKRSSEDTVGGGRLRRVLHTWTPDVFTRRDRGVSTVRGRGAESRPPRAKDNSVDGVQRGNHCCGRVPGMFCVCSGLLGRRRL